MIRLCDARARRLRLLALLLVLVSSSAARVADAETAEAAVGVTGGVMMPAYASQDSTAFRLVTFTAGGFARYGVLEDLDLVLRFEFSLFRGKSRETRELQGRELVGDRYFRAEQYQVAAGARYKLVSGYDLAPYLEAAVGWQWRVLRDQQFLSPEGLDFGLELGPEGQGALSLTAGVAVDYRLFNLVQIGAAFRWTELLFHNGERQRALTLPVEVAYYW